jgi:hypothetical protein
MLGRRAAAHLLRRYAVPLLRRQQRLCISSSAGNDKRDKRARLQAEFAEQQKNSKQQADDEPPAIPVGMKVIIVTAPFFVTQ